MKTTHLHLLRSGCRLAGLSMLTAAAAAQAQVPAAAPEGVLNLSAQATVEAPQDWMTLVLSVTREGSDATQVQQQLKQAVEGAMAQARRQARPGQVELRSGAFSVFPRYGSKGGITGWQGSTELVIEGRDMPAIAQLSGQIGSLTISRVGYSLSREAREKLQTEATAQAIARFRADAGDYARQFGFGSYTLREVSVNTDGGASAPVPRFQVAMAAAKVGDGEALPVEAGKGSVTATVSGSIQLK
ncbi:SIMPL domain-containing protein [Ideonella sp. B508-1]|uniref:SIMPL domain-containing protein n=1 Tax=Ideonella sp. B508-1 TaxID=137716 RepID=UPI00034546B8|nr:SIMPL domain-containing protein [Ideonella sp. B508-1]